MIRGCGRLGPGIKEGGPRPALAGNDWARSQKKAAGEGGQGVSSGAREERERGLESRVVFAHKLHEIGPRAVEEGDVSLRGHDAREERLASPGWADHQHA